MDFDDADSDAPTFEEMVQSARLNILNISDPRDPVDWGVIGKRYDAYTDVTKEANTRGEVMGPVLVAMNGITRAISAHEDAEGIALTGLAKVYWTIYQASPVPPKAAWEQEVRAVFTEGKEASSLAALIEEALPTRAAYVDSVAAVTAGAADDADAYELLAEDDGSFVDEAFKAFLQRCLVAGRKCSRSVDAARRGHLKDMLAAVTRFLSSGTFEW